MLIKIANLKEYQVPERDDVLRDDFRIALAWYSTVKQKKKFKFTESEIVSLIERLLDEALFKFRFVVHLENMKEVTRDLLLSLIKKKLKGTWPISRNAFDLIELSTQTAFLTPKKLEKGIWALQREKTGKFGEVPTLFINVLSSKRITEKELFETRERHFSSEEEFKLEYPSKLIYLNEFRIVGTYTETKKFAPVNPSGKKLGEKLFLNELLPFFKDYIVIDNFICLTGGVVNRGYSWNDVDIVIRGELPDPLLRAIWFRLIRQLPREWWNRCQYLSDEGIGPYTPYFPLYRLKIERIPNAEVIQMGATLPKADLEIDLVKAELRVKNPRFQAEAKRSREEDKIVPFRFFYPLKTSLAIQAYRVGELYSIKEVIEYLQKLVEKDFETLNLKELSLSDLGENLAILEEIDGHYRPSSSKS